MTQETNDRTIKKTGITTSDYLIEKFPDSPHFLGKDIYYPSQRRNGVLRNKDFPQLNPLREKVHKFSEREHLDNTRDEILKHLKRFPNSPDLNALKAIQVYNDITQGGIAQNRLELMADSLARIAKALHNGGVNFFNVTWFVTIYLKYLDMIRERIAREYGASVQQGDTQVRLSGQRLYQKLLKVPRMADIQSNLKTLTTLGIKLKGSAFVTEPITRLELLKACEAIARRREKKVVAPGKTAGNIIFIILTLNVMFSKIPILRNLVDDYLKQIPNSSRDLILQKHLILNTARVTDFQLAIATGNQKLAKDMANRIYNDCLFIIDEYLGTALLRKMFEVDPFIKAIWIAKESADLLEKNVARKRLEHAVKLLKTVSGERCQFKGVYGAVAQLQNRVDTLLSDLSR